MVNAVLGVVNAFLACYQENSGPAGFLQVVERTWEFVAQQGLELIQEVLRGVEERRDKGVCPDCGHEGVRQHRGEPKSYRTTFGTTEEIQRSEYWCRSCEKYFYPLDDELGVVKDGEIARDLQEVVVFHSTKVSYDEAVENVQHDYGQKVSAKEAQLLAQRARKEIQKEDLQVEKPVEQKNRAYVSQDGVLVKSCEEGKQWQMINAGMTFSEVVEISEGRREVRDKEYVASTESTGVFDDVLYDACKRRGGLDAEEIVYLGDGHETIKRFYEQKLRPLEIGGKKVLPILDPYHLSEKLDERAAQMIPDRAKRRTFQDLMWHLLWEGQTEKAEQQLLAETVKGHRAMEAKEKFLSYLVRNRTWIPNYANLKEQGYTISSGPMEKANDTIAARRMKRKGMRWSRVGADVIATLRVLKANGRWNAFWGRRAAG